MDRDSLLPPALSESLHIPPWLPWLLEAQALSGAGPLSAAETHTDPPVTHKQNNNRETTEIADCLSVCYFQSRAAPQIFPDSGWVSSEQHKLFLTYKYFHDSPHRGTSLRGRYTDTERCDSWSDLQKYFMALAVGCDQWYLIFWGCAPWISMLLLDLPSPIFAGRCRGPSTSSPLRTSQELTDACDRLPWEEWVLPTDRLLSRNLRK